jgi:two-component system sensor histidine kinase/response regulator
MEKLWYCISRKRINEAKCAETEMVAFMNTITYEMDTRTALPHILIVDTNLEAVALVMHGLGRNYRFTTVGNTAEALGFLDTQSVDLVMLDVTTRKNSTEDLLAAMRNRTDTAHVPVILTSGEETREDLLAGLDSGANDYLLKPFDVEMMKARVQAHMETKRLLDEQQRTITYLRNVHDIKDRLLRIATHDLKSPLNSIHLAQYYLRTVIGSDPASIEALDAIEDTVNTINGIVEDFLDSAALESGQPDLHLRGVELESLLWEVIARYGVTASRKNIALLLGESDGFALADSARLAQIVSNLVSNAIKYSPFSGMITVASTVVGDRVRITVADEGPGIPLEERPQLFQPFSKLSTRPTGGETSTGLGLWIVKELVRMHNGTVGAEFPAGGGSVFWIELPRYAE